MTPSMRLWSNALSARNSPATKVGRNMNSPRDSARDSTREKMVMALWSFSAGTCFSSHRSNLEGLAASSSGK